MIRAGAIDATTVVAHRLEDIAYPKSAPYAPAVAYPEHEFGAVGTEPNPVYDGVRATFAAAGLDAARFGTAEWNPLGELIAPGETVVLKPNMIKEFHPRHADGWQWVLTHGSVVRSVADYVAKAVKPSGRVVVADAPQTDSSFTTMVEMLGFDRLRDLYADAGVEFDLVDLRQEEWTNRDGVIVSRRALSGDPAGAVAFDLGDKSEFTDHERRGDYYGADYDASVVNHHHTGGRHRYLLSGSVMNADVVFSLPKLKTHKKAGITVSLKNLVGITADKNWLPHHTEGGPEQGGDEHPTYDLGHRIERSAVAALQRLSLRFPRLGTWIHRRARPVGTAVFGDTESVVRSGNWWGNDTIWRMCLDLNKLVLYGNPDGSMRPPAVDQQRRHLVLVDGVLAGEGRGPMNPDAVAAGLLLFGLHPASVDAAAAVLMGFDPERIPIVRQAFRARHYPIADWQWADVRLLSNRPKWDGVRLADVPPGSIRPFEPHFGWKGHIERASELQSG